MGRPRTPLPAASPPPPPAFPLLETLERLGRIADGIDAVAARLGALGAERAAPDRLAYSIAEAAERLGVSAWLLEQAMLGGEIPSFRLGRRVLISRARLEALLAGEALCGRCKATLRGQDDWLKDALHAVGVSA